MISPSKSAFHSLIKAYKETSTDCLNLAACTAWSNHPRTELYGFHRGYSVYSCHRWDLHRNRGTYACTTCTTSCTTLYGCTNLLYGPSSTCLTTDGSSSPCCCFLSSSCLSAQLFNCVQYLFILSYLCFF
jgi:hypothetical protein